MARRNNSGIDQHDATRVDALPAGTKKVTRTTREDFIEKKPDDSKLDDETNESLEPELDDDGSDEFEGVEVLSPVQNFLSSLKERIGDGSIRIYAIRKPDPSGLTFRNPCNNEYTAGDVPYDETDLSVEALEVTIQKLYGGGRYQIKVRQNGNYAGAITRNVHDLPESNPGVVQSSTHQQVNPAPAQVAPPEPRLSVREELKEVLDLAERIATISHRNPPHESERKELPPIDPFKAAEASLGMLEKAKNLFDRGEPAVTSGGDRHWSEGVINGVARLFDSMKVGDLVVGVGQTITQEVIRQRREAALQEASNGNHADATTTSHQPPAQTALPSSAGGNVGASPPTVEVVPPVVATEPPAPTVTAEEQRVLEIVVTELRGYEDDENQDLLDERVARAVEALRTLPKTDLDQLLVVPNTFLLVYLVQVNPEWADVADMEDAGGFIGALKKALRDGPAGQGNGELVDFPSLAAVESIGSKEKENGTEKNAETSTASTNTETGS